MMKRRILWSLIMVILLASFAFAQGCPQMMMHGKPGSGKPDCSARVERLSRDLGLSDEQKTAVTGKMKAMGDLSQQFFQKRKTALTEMKTLLESGKSESELAQKIRQLREAEQSFHNRMKTLQEEMTSILSTEQQAKYLLLQDRFPHGPRPPMPGSQAQPGEEAPPASF
jgi:Spy/CpxP family protein refolding chaperone